MTAKFFTPGFPAGTVTVISGSGVGQSYTYQRMKRGTFNQFHMSDIERFVLYNLDEEGFFTGKGYEGNSDELTVQWLDFCNDTDWWFNMEHVLDTFYDYRLINSKTLEEYEVRQINKWLMVPATPIEDDTELATVDWPRAITVAEFLVEYGGDMDEWNK